MLNQRTYFLFYYFSCNYYEYELYYKEIVLFFLDCDFGGLYYNKNPPTF